MLLNKVDCEAGAHGARQLQLQHPGSVAVSARTRHGFPTLMSDLGAMLRPIRDFVALEIPYARPELIARLHSVGQIVESDFNGEKAKFRVRLPAHLRHEFHRFQVDEDDSVPSPISA